MYTNYRRTTLLLTLGMLLFMLSINQIQGKASLPLLTSKPSGGFTATSTPAETTITPTAATTDVPTDTATPEDSTPTETATPDLGTPTDTPAPTTSPIVTATPTECASFNFQVEDLHMDTIRKAVAVGDFNNDGKADLLVDGETRPDTAGIHFIAGNGDGSFQPPRYIYRYAGNNIVTADFDHDGNLDYVTLNADGIFFEFGDGDGHFVRNLVLPYIATFGSDIAVGDFNNDGNDDLATAHRLYLGNGSGQFSLSVVYDPDAHTLAVVVADFNGDGNLDLADINFAGEIWVKMGDGAGGLGPTHQYEGGVGAAALAQGDFNHDGIVDLATGTDEGVAILLGHGDGSFAAPHYSGGVGQAINLGLGDFNSDGNTDFVIAHQFGFAPLYIIEGDSAGGFSNIHEYDDISSSNGTIATADLNHDSKVDIATTVGGALRVLINSCTPAPTRTPNGATPTPNCLPTPVPTDCGSNFSDINNNVFADAINALYCGGVVRGTDGSHYSPTLTTTRAQFAKVVTLGFNIAGYTPPHPTFSDVPVNHYAYLFIESGYHAGILSGLDQAGCAATGVTFPCFGQAEPISRAQLTKLVVLAAQFPLTTPTSNTFSDVPPSNPFYTVIETAVAHRIISGYSDHVFQPDHSVRRDEMAQIVYNAITALR